MTIAQKHINQVITCLSSFSVLKTFLDDRSFNSVLFVLPKIKESVAAHFFLDCLFPTKVKATNKSMPGKTKRDGGGSSFGERKTKAVWIKTTLDWNDCPAIDALGSFVLSPQSSNYWNPFLIPGVIGIWTSRDRQCTSKATDTVSSC